MKRRIMNKLTEIIGGIWAFCWVLAITFFSVWLAGKGLDLLLNLIGGM